MLKGVGIDTYSQLESPCDFCSRCKTSTESRRHFERARVLPAEVSGRHFQSRDPGLRAAIQQMADSTNVADQAERDDQHGTTVDDRSRLARILKTLDSDLHSLSDQDRQHLSAARHSTIPGQYWHCDTIQIVGAWQGFTEALVMVDDFSRKLFVYAMKNKRQEQVVSALRHHFLREATTPAGINFYTDGAILRRNQGSEFVNASVQVFCDDMGCIQEFSRPGGGKWQNGLESKSGVG